MLKHSCISHGLVKIGSNGVGSVTSNNDAAHSTLLQSFGNLAKEFVLSIIVRIDNDDLTNVFLAEHVNRLDLSFKMLSGIVQNVLVWVN